MNEEARDRTIDLEGIRRSMEHLNELLDSLPNEEQKYKLLM